MRDLGSLAGFLAFGECEFAARAQKMRRALPSSLPGPFLSDAHVARDERSGDPGCRCAHPGIYKFSSYNALALNHPLAASGGTHSNSGN
jgi:hypothetical protein